MYVNNGRVVSWKCIVMDMVLETKKNPSQSGWASYHTNASIFHELHHEMKNFCSRNLHNFIFIFISLSWWLKFDYLSWDCTDLVANLPLSWPWRFEAPRTARLQFVVLWHAMPNQHYQCAKTHAFKAAGVNRLVLLFKFQCTVAVIGMELVCSLNLYSSLVLRFSYLSAQCLFLFFLSRLKT